MTNRLHNNPPDPIDDALAPFGDNPKWVQKWSPIYDPLPYAARLLIFEALPLTSLLTTRQMAEYMNSIQIRYRQMGINLIDPDARSYEGEFGPRV